MVVAQQLYEGVELGEAGPIGLITYMRTDATRVADSARETARALVTEGLGPDYLPAEPPKYKAGKRAQEAHEAIRPTDPTRTPATVRPFLDEDQFRLYRLIWERFMASEMAPAVYATLTAEFDAGGWVFRSSGSELEFPGFLAVTGLGGPITAPGADPGDGETPAGGGATQGGDGRMEEENRGDQVEAGEEEREESPLVLPELAAGQEVNLVRLDPEQHFTTPPPRYSEAGLVRAMEELGIGRPSTYAPTIETILSRGYAEKLDGRLVPTKLGRVVTGLLLTHFPDIIDVAFTAAMEEQLDEVEEGDLPWRKVVRDFYEPFSTALENARKELERVEVPEEETGITCEACGRPMVVKYGRYGRFLACSGYPECRQTRPYAVATGLECPKCGAEVVEKRTRKGRRFYGCIRYPECDFSVWSRPVERKCPECGTFMVAAARGDGKPATARGRGGNGEAAARGGDGAGRDQDQAGTTRTGEGQVAEAPVRYVRCANEACGHEEIERPPA